MNKIVYGANILDSRDLIRRCEELQGEVDALIDAVHDVEDREGLDDALDNLAAWLECSVDDLYDCELEIGTTFGDLDYDGLALSDDARELSMLRSVMDLAESEVSDWTSGIALVSDSYFTDYARELAEDCGCLPRDLAWPLNYIDWEAAAAALQTDYSSIYINGTLYWAG